MSSCSRYGLLRHSEDSDPVGGILPDTDISKGSGLRTLDLSLGTGDDAMAWAKELRFDVDGSMCRRCTVTCMVG